MSKWRSSTGSSCLRNAKWRMLSAKQTFVLVLAVCSASHLVTATEEEHSSDNTALSTRSLSHDEQAATARLYFQGPSYTINLFPIVFLIGGLYLIAYLISTFADNFSAEESYGGSISSKDYDVSGSGSGYGAASDEEVGFSLPSLGLNREGFGGLASNIASGFLDKAQSTLESLSSIYGAGYNALSSLVDKELKEEYDYGGGAVLQFQDLYGNDITDQVYDPNGLKYFPDYEDTDSGYYDTAHSKQYDQNEPDPYGTSFTNAGSSYNQYSGGNHYDNYAAPAPAPAPAPPAPAPSSSYNYYRSETTTNPNSYYYTPAPPTAAPDLTAYGGVNSLNVYDSSKPPFSGSSYNNGYNYISNSVSGPESNRPERKAIYEPSTQSQSSNVIHVNHGYEQDQIVAPPANAPFAPQAVLSSSTTTPAPLRGNTAPGNSFFAAISSTAGGSIRIPPATVSSNVIYGSQTSGQQQGSSFIFPSDDSEAISGQGYVFYPKTSIAFGKSSSAGEVIPVPNNEVKLPLTADNHVFSGTRSPEIDLLNVVSGPTPTPVQRQFKASERINPIDTDSVEQISSAIVPSTIQKILRESHGETLPISSLEKLIAETAAELLKRRREGRQDSDEDKHASQYHNMPSQWSL